MSTVFKSITVSTFKMEMLYCFASFSLFSYEVRGIAEYFSSKQFALQQGVCVCQDHTAAILPASVLAIVCQLAVMLVFFEVGSQVMLP